MTPRLPAVALAALLGLAAASPPAAAQEPPRADAPAAAPCAPMRLRVADGCRTLPAVGRALERIVRGAMEEKHLAATILRASHGGRPLVAAAWGESMPGAPARPEMRFRNGAVAVAYMTTALLLLAEEGVLSLDDPVATWRPDYPRAGAVTLRMLANHTSGYADYVDLEALPLYEDPFRRWRPAELIAIGLEKPPVCDPGACFAYAHTNHMILAEAMEAATGRSLARLIRERVLEPLGLGATRSHSASDIPEPALHAYSAERGLYENSTFWSPSWTLPPGAVMTTDIADMERSAIAIGAGSLLAPRSFRAMTAEDTVGLGPITPALYYGLGVVVNNGWIVQALSFYGWNGVAAYEPGSGAAIALVVTEGPAAPAERLAEDLFYELAAYLVPEAPPRPFGASENGPAAAEPAPPRAPAAAD